MYPRTILETAQYHFESSFDDLLQQIELDCSHYLQSSVTLFKQLPSTTQNAQKVKLRHRRSDDFHQNFNECFDVSKLYERSLTCYTTLSRELTEGFEWFAIFPPNSFKYLYNPACSDLNNLRDVDPTLLKQVVDLSYFSEQLQSHTHLDPEVIIFNMPSYYAIRVQV